MFYLLYFVIIISASLFLGFLKFNGRIGVEKINDLENFFLQNLYLHFIQPIILYIQDEKGCGAGSPDDGGGA